jgi:hypothetical protein
MDLLERLQKNTGTISSALGKTLANRVMAGEGGILDKCIEYSSIHANDKQLKNIRSGAAKVVEIVAEKKPELVQKSLEKLLPALSVNEPQTRWMIIRTMGFCAKKNPAIARKAIPFAKKYIDEKEGLCIASSADLFLGDYGSLSAKNAKEAFPIIEKSMKNCVINEQDWILEALLKLYPVLGDKERKSTRKFANKWKDWPRKSTQKRAKNILEYEV